MTRSVLVTGGTGFIGLHLARRLVDEGARVTLLDNGFRSARDAEVEELVRRSGASVVSADLTNSGAMRDVAGPFDEVYHLAAIVGVRFANERPAEVLRTNVVSTLTLLDWLRVNGTGRLLFSSTSEVYAASVDLGLAPVPTPERVLLSIGDGHTRRYSYGLSKIVGETLVRESAARDGYAQTTVRLHNVYGPRMGYEHVVPQVLERITAGESPFRVFGARQRRAFCYIDDAATSILALARSPGAAGQVVNVGNDREEIAITDLVKLMFEITGYAAPLDEREASEGSVERRCPDLTLLRTLIGDLGLTTLRAGLAATAAWYRAHGPVRA